jgi:signal transduction histidine kinase
MFSGLRLRLTLLYLLTALAFVALVGGGAYQLVESYFQTTTDLALKHKMAEELRLRGLSVPAELAEAEQAWFANHQQTLTAPAAPTRRPGREDHDSDDHESHDDHAAQEAYDADLATIFVLPLSHGGQVLYDQNIATPPFAPNQAAFDTALMRGDDLRTVTLPDGRRTRVLTYRLLQSNGPAAMQLGRLLTDQDRVQKRLLLGLLALGGASTLLLGVASWWLAGRSIRPAHQAWERQQSFVANASHELRTPLTLLRASAEVALRTLPADDADRRELLGDVLQECDHMGQLVEDLLLLSRLDAGRMPMERAQIALPNLLADVERQVGRVAEERGVRVADEGASGAIWGDPTRIRQVLLILLDNALRHTPPGGAIHLAAHSSGRHAQISVADTGSGIAPEHLPRLFDRFYRVDGPRGDSNSGSGLGLSIAKALVEAQGGQIAVESQVGHGTKVVVALPGAEG